MAEVTPVSDLIIKAYKTTDSLEADSIEAEYKSTYEGTEEEPPMEAPAPGFVQTVKRLVVYIGTVALYVIVVLLVAVTG